MNTSYDAGTRLRRHYHAQTYLCVVLGGRFEERCGHDDWECASGTLIFNPCAEPHQDRFGPAVQCINIEPTADWLTAVRDGNPLPDRPVYVRSPATVHGARRLAAEMRRRDEASILCIETLVLELVQELARLSIRAASDSRPRWLADALDLIHSRFAESISVRSIAEAAGVHPAHLARTFRTHLRCSVGEYVRRLRLEAAHRALTLSSVPLAHVAFDAGFYDQCHLCRSIRRHWGLTPRRLRARGSG